MLNYSYTMAQIRQYSKLSGTSSSTPVTPVIIYLNAETDKSKILTDNKGRAGIYLWAHIGSNSIYVGSAVDLSIRLSLYYYPSYLKRTKNYICNALNCHTHSAFSLTILEYINIKGLSKEEIKKLILEREQFYIDSLEPKYNILRVAGSLLGFNHSNETLAKMSQVKLGENNPMYGQIVSTQTKALITEAKGTTIFVYSSDNVLTYSFPSARKAAIYFKVSKDSILRYVKHGKLLKGQWVLTTSLIIKE
jgi:predicted GIY-YIG superfamily endonuclease